jgi:hypothetical protein
MMMKKLCIANRRASMPPVAALVHSETMNGRAPLSSAIRRTHDKRVE